MKTIYKTIGAAKEYCDYAIDIYENCPHKCSYCYAKLKVENKNKNFEFSGVRKNILEETRKFLDEHKEIYGKMIFLGFSSDAIPYKKDISATIDVIKLLKEYNCKIMLCTKSCIFNDMVKEIINLVDSVGITLTCGDEMAKIYEKNAALPSERLELLKYAKTCNCETWISFEPVLDTNYIINLLKSGNIDFVDILKFGKLNHMEISDLTKNEKDFIDWNKYLIDVITICENKNYKYLIKKALKEYS